MEDEPVFHEISINLIRSGRLAQIVYNIKYRPAWRRSGWYPHPIISKSVGIKEDSNII